ncbi:hypothetical protein C5167_003845 [Papaver somniferum]|uniref:LisH domain-containing protein n=1 Tax=Papaver somniferum TaxID=3469 RepID=A0A4Y7L237_PAPSO|nr:uncharacterized protein LOC113314074 [Papaver somniferum]RZC78421.1 hypothetical protein C5167_003845 [Papaver somniferum]
MVKQTKPKKVGKGKVTPIQVAFIVDQYLIENNFSETRSVFRTEASAFLAKTQSREAPKSLLSLEAILDEYICLKEQKVMVDHEKCMVEQEKFRVEVLLQGMKDVMQAYNNNNGSISTPSLMSATDSTGLISQLNPNTQPTTGNSIYKTPTMNCNPLLTNSTNEITAIPTPTISSITSGNKRRCSRKAPDDHPIAKRPCNSAPKKLTPVRGPRKQMQARKSSSPPEKVQACSPQEQTQQQQVSAVQSTTTVYRFPNGPTQIQGSSVAKSLFNQPSTSPTKDSTGPKTPPQAFVTQTDKSISPSEGASLIKSTTSSPQEITPRKCSLNSSEKVHASPFKHVSYYSVERKSHYISSSPNKTPLKRLSKREHVKGRLDFDSANVTTSLEPSTAEVSTSGTDGEGDMFDMDVPNFDIFGADFSLSELLVDIDYNCEGTGLSTDFSSGTIHEYGNSSLDENQSISELPLSVRDFLCQQNMNIQGSESIATSVQSITKRITTILSPAKTKNSPSMDQENLS